MIAEQILIVGYVVAIVYVVIGLALEDRYGTPNDSIVVRVLMTMTWPRWYIKGLVDAWREEQGAPPRRGPRRDR